MPSVQRQAGQGLLDPEQAGEVGTGGLAGFAGRGPERLTAFLPALLEHLGMVCGEAAATGQGGGHDRLQPGVVEGQLVEIGIGTPAA